MLELPQSFTGSTQLDSSEGFLKGAFLFRDVPNVTSSFNLNQKGLEIRCSSKPPETEGPKFFDRLIRAVVPKKEVAQPAIILKLQSTRLAQAFREQDQVHIYSSDNKLGIACIRQNQLAFALGDLSELLPLKGAANLVFENMSEDFVLRTSLKPLNLKAGRVVPVGYYNVALLSEQPFVTIVRSGISLTMDDLKHLQREWTLQREKL